VSHPGSVAAPAAALGGPDDAFSRASIGIVPILWNNADLPNLVPAVPADHVLDEIARLGFEGTQTGTGYPSPYRRSSRRCASATSASPRSTPHSPSS
jgi:hypothetical protein